MNTLQRDTLPILVDGAWLTQMLRMVDGPTAALSVPELTCEQLTKIRNRTARLEGDSRNGFVYVEEI